MAEANSINSTGVDVGEARIIVPTWMSFIGLVICTLTFSLNFVFLMLTIKAKKLREKTGVFLILCLCVSDTFAGAGGIVFSITYLIPGLPSNKPFCSFHMHLYITGIIMSIAQTFVISFHRFLVAMGVSWHRYLGKKRVLVFMFLLIQLSFLASISMQEHEIAYCELRNLYGSYYEYYTILINIFTIPFTIFTFILYLIALCLIRKRFRQTHGLNVHQQAIASTTSQIKNEFSETTRTTQAATCVSESSSQSKTKLMKIFKTVGIILCVFFILTIPIVLVMFLESVGIQVKRSIRLPSSFLPLVNSVLNPFIYAFRLEDVRMEIRKKIF